MVKLLKTLLLFLPVTTWAAQSLNIAVTASFKPVMDVLVPEFEDNTGVKVLLSSASSGVLTQQIVAGAPFDIFFSADAARPEKIAEVLKLPQSRVQPYAEGTLVLISTLDTVTSVSDLAQYHGKLILANPQHAPYGVAASEVLDTIGFQGARVQANNVTQARQYLSLNMAPVGLIAQSVADELSPQYAVDSDLYSPIVQKRVVVHDSEAVEQLLEYLQTPVAEQVIEGFGYRVPEN